MQLLEKIEPNGAREYSFASFSINQDVVTTAGSLIWRKDCTKVKFSQTLGGGGLKQIPWNDFSQFGPWFLDYEFLGMS